MIFGIFTLLVAIIISLVSAFYSVTGLTAIFAAAFWPIVIMGGALEIGKITATVWLHKHWKRSTWQFKLYLVPAILILMVITSMGTYGYLAKAHLDQATPSGNIESKIEIIEDKIQYQKDVITQNQLAVDQLNLQINKYSELGAVSKGVKVRNNQRQERESLQASTQSAQDKIELLNNEKHEISKELRAIEAEVGPIKYIAALIYGDNPDADLLERAVRWVIILLVLVFDPLALVLILAAEQTITWAREDRKQTAGWHQEWVPNTENPWHNEPKYEPDDGELTDAQIDEINTQANVDDVEMTSTLFDTEEEFFAHGKEVAREFDAQEDRLPEDYASTQAYLHTPYTWFKNNYPEPESSAEDPLDIPILEGEEMWAQEAIDSVDHSADNELTPTETVATFGTAFPTTPNRGDLFLKVDQLPNRQYKWNGRKWIELDQKAVDRYMSNDEYLQFLLEMVRVREYHLDDLSSVERDYVIDNLTYHEKSRL
jgi:hypothetical protein